MKKLILSSIIVLISTFSVNTSFAQATVAMDFNRMDCNGNAKHLFADLDSGKAVILFYFMPSCGSCPPPAQKIQAMANNINASHPGKVKAYAFPFNNTTTCSYTQTWVTSNSLPLYSPMDSGATSVAHYGGFGMPTVVLLGGSNHRVMFSTLSFSTSDTTRMRDSILALITPSKVNDISGTVDNIKIYPNPTANNLSISFDLVEQCYMTIDMADVTGKQVAVIAKENATKGSVTKKYNTAALANGVYYVRINANGKNVTEKVYVSH